MSNYMAVADALKEQPARAQECVVSVESVVRGLSPVHDADDPPTRPTAPCVACGQVRWRVWCHDERKVWQWICNRCRPLVVRNHDGTIWRSDAP